MARIDTEAKQRIEAKYDRDDGSVDAGTDRIGQMTIAFCVDDYCTQRPTSDWCSPQ